jgi:LuxR family transcriptional regulator, maltose regulon positive regulatory protein
MAMTAARRTDTTGRYLHVPAGPRPPAGLVERSRLFDVLDQTAAAPVTLVSAPAGSGKTTLLASWLHGQDGDRAVAWVGVEREETDATHFWSSVMDALRQSGAVASDDALATLTPAPIGGHEEFVDRLLEGLGRLTRPVYLLVDDLHELHAEDAVRTLGRLLEQAPARLHIFLVSRRDPKLPLHRLRLAGQLVEIRAADLEFTAEESAGLLAAAEIDIEPDAIARLHERTEGWAAALRLAAMSLARHDDPERFVAEFAGSERTVADYLLGEVLDRQPPEVRDLLLRTCILEQVNGALADLLTGRHDGDRLLHELEAANALVVATDVARTWFRYHHLLSDLLRLELRREGSYDVKSLHRRAAAWYADHDHPIDAIRHARLGEDWALTVELLGRTWVHLLLDGEEATLGALLDGLPAKLVEHDAELATITAVDRLFRSRWVEADMLLSDARRSIEGMPSTRHRRARTALATVQLFRARQLGVLDTVVDDANLLLGDADSVATVDAELQALALMNLGIVKTWTFRLAEAEPHLEQGLTLGRTIGRPYIEVACLTALGVLANMTMRPDLSEQRLREAISIADRVGWSTHPMLGPTYMTLGSVLIDRGALSDGERWLDRADRIMAESLEPAAGVGLRHIQGQLHLCRGRFADALASFREAERIANQLRAPHFLAEVERPWQLRAQLRLGEVEAVRDALHSARDTAAWCNLAAMLCLEDRDPQGAADAVAPVLAGKAFALHVNLVIEAFVLDALARRALGEREASEASVERAFQLAEPHGRVWIFLSVPGVQELVESHPTHRTTHAAFLKTLHDHLAGAEAAARDELAPELREPLSDRELAVLRFLPTNLSAAEIGSELYLSVHTVKTHMRKLYAKLEVHTRAEAVQRGRALGLLGPSRRER